MRFHLFNLCLFLLLSLFLRASHAAPSSSIRRAVAVSTPSTIDELNALKSIDEEKDLDAFESMLDIEEDELSPYNSASDALYYFADANADVDAFGVPMIDADLDDNSFGIESVDDDGEEDFSIAQGRGRRGGFRGGRGFGRGFRGGFRRGGRRGFRRGLRRGGRRFGRRFGRGFGRRFGRRFGRGFGRGRFGRGRWGRGWGRWGRWGGYYPYFPEYYPVAYPYPYPYPAYGGFGGDGGEQFQNINLSLGLDNLQQDTDINGGIF